jgi:hypothetical protein
MNKDRADLIKSDLMSGIQTEFTPKLVAPPNTEMITVIPDYANRKWIIKIIAYSPELSLGLNKTYTVDNVI